MYLYLILLTYFLNSVIAQEIPDLSNLNLNELKSKLPIEFQQTNITLDDAKEILKNKCIEAANGDQELGKKHYEDVENGTMGLMECITNVVNYTAIQEEIEEAKPHGELDVVFHKYCSKRPEALSCIDNFNMKLVPCLDVDERENKDILMRIVTSLLNFICHKGGDQIALFIAEKGPECISSKKDEIQNCLNATLSSYIPAEGVEGFNNQKLPKFVMGQKQCEDLQQMETCIVKHLEKCSDITPANLVESMFRFIRNETICYNTTIRISNGAGLMSCNSTFLVILLLFITYLASRKNLV